MPMAENSKELCTPMESMPDPREYGSDGAQISRAGGATDSVSSGKDDAMSFVVVAMAPSIADTTC